MPMTFPARDGALLAYRDEGAGLPLLCLAGLTRTMADFDYMIPHLPAGIRLIRMDYRGRGESRWTGAATYTVLQEAQDALALLDHLGVAKAAVIGTSRGGLIGMVLAAMAKDRLLGLCLNDIGPVIERDGLAKIKDYVGRNPVSKTHAALAASMPRTMAGFAKVPESRWMEEAVKHYHATETGLKVTYDPTLRDSFLAAFDGPPVDMWPLWQATAGLPVALIRGANSDLLSLETVAQMQAIRPDLIFADVPDRAHIPFLDEPESVSVLHHFLKAVA
ncbi:MAG: alpha/beta hydrolase [Rhodobacteraceae bacterium PARR1]|nr:MAG: alpha/beta hydrolase [Rhodobacteraceae bacterium PARR1]